MIVETRYWITFTHKNGTRHETMVYSTSPDAVREMLNGYGHTLTDIERIG